VLIQNFTLSICFHHLTLQESELAVQKALDGLLESGSRTMITIAHRLSTICGADVIVVVDGGQIVEQSNHETLI
jgi:ABC-type multidrug transport system fused ATPase/permease subunit